MITIVIAMTAAVLIALRLWRWTDRSADRATWSGLVAYGPSAPGRFDPSMVSELAEPVQRFFRFAIRPGTPLQTVAEILMDGELSLGSKANPNYRPMSAEQILAAPHGFVWKVRLGGVTRISGSDGTMQGKSWSRFWLLGVLPVARAGNNADHARAAFGRCVAEAIFWTPAALLPGDFVQWEAVDESTIRVTVTCLGLEQAVDLAVRSDGSPATVIFQRWSDANPDRRYTLQPFGGFLSDYREFGGFRLPTRIEAGNFFATDDYFPFFRANVRSIRFPLAAATRRP